MINMIGIGSYDDRSVVVVNGTDRRVVARVVARILNLDMSEKFSREIDADLPPDSTRRVLAIPEMAGLSATYFVDLRLVSPAGHALSSNLYWLSTAPDDLDWEKSTWFTTPAKAYADFTALNTLPAARVKTSMSSKRQGSEEEARVTVTNTGTTLAFFVRLQITKGAGGEEVLPVLWEDNYISLLPGERRMLTATYRLRDLGASGPTLVVSGWNVAAGTVAPR